MQRVVVADTDDEREDAFAVRHTVFVEEQGVPEDLEWDEYDADAVHFVAYDDEGTPVGAARLRTEDVGDGVGKVERVAVLEPRRGEGWGDRLMDVLEAEAADRGLTELKLHAQTHAAGFYSRRDYVTVGEEFEEAGIPHVEMTKEL